MAKIILCNSDETGFLFDCPSLMLVIANHCIQHSQEMLEHRVTLSFMSAKIEALCDHLYDVKLYTI